MRTKSFFITATVLLLSLSAGANDQSTSAAIDAAYHYLENHAERLTLDAPRRQLFLQHQRIDHMGSTHLRFQHVVGDVPVWGEEIIVHIDSEGSVYRVDGKITPGLDGIKTTPRLTAKEAGKRAEVDGWSTKAARLVILAVESPHVAYEIELVRGLARRFVFIDAMDGRTIKQLNGTMH